MQEYISALKHAEIFRNLTEEELLCVLPCLNAVVKDYERGSVIAVGGERAKFLGIVLSGTVQAGYTDYYGTEKTVSVAQPADFIADIAYFMVDKPLPFDIVACTDSTVLCLDIEDLIYPCRKVCSPHLKVVRSLFSSVAGCCIDFKDKLDILTERTTREKILSLLFTQSNRVKGEEFTVSMSRQQMADFLSVNRSALSRELCKMRDEGILDFNNNTFCFKK